MESRYTNGVLMAALWNLKGLNGGVEESRDLNNSIEAIKWIQRWVPGYEILTAHWVRSHSDGA